MAPGFASQLIGGDSARWLAGELARETGTTDTHPSLRDRLRALGLPEPQLGPVAAPAAESLLGAARGDLVAEIDVAWRHRVADWWKQEHARRTGMRSRRATLEASAAAGPLPLSEKFELAKLLMAGNEPDRAEPLLQEVLGEAPEHADAHAHLGALLAKRDDPAAIGHLELAIQKDPGWTLSAGEILHGQLTKAGRKADADELLTRVRAYHENASAAKREASLVRQTQAYVALELGPAERAAVAEALRKEGRAVRRAWLVGRIPVAGQAPVPLLVVERRAAWWRYASSSAAPDLLKRLAGSVPLPAGGQLIVLGDRTRWLLRRARSIAGAQVFPETSR
jgi:tetratricopeptide (TPR) repeat protein